ncbi:MAG: aminoacyl-tRNA hydrolase [Candidatus Rokubacteria bacterium]|nr:aminoacyl-tRNA hydrolase [Candidatus Rokubacteria bacterium]
MAQGIVGLGNPGPEYRDTRHNMGARALDALAKKLKVRFRRVSGHWVAHAKWRGDVVYLIKPQCFMNAMGSPVARITRKLQLVAGDLIFVYDDLDLPLGRVRVRLKGSAGGHNGMRSLISTLGTDQLRRVKVGIGRPASPGRGREVIVDHVLSAFLPDELPAVEAACLEAGAQAVKLVEAHNARHF